MNRFENDFFQVISQTVKCVCCYGNVNLEHSATFYFLGIFLPGVEHLQLYQLLICIFSFLSFENLL